MVYIYSFDGATKLASYGYDAWGNVVSVTDTSTTGIASINPIRYRGYYYDTDLDLYYLQSRYYNPKIGRFLNADSQLNQDDGPLGFNMFAYCNNNPVNMCDPDGHESATWENTRKRELGGQNIASFLFGVYKFIKEILPLITTGISAINTINKVSNTAVKADAKVKNTVKRNSKDRYWTATVNKDYVDAAGGTSKNATQVINEINKGKTNTPGFYYHYHTHDRSGGHVYYLF